MVKAVPDILARIVEQKRRELKQRNVNNTAAEEAAAEAAISGRRDFTQAISGDSPAIIAELKKASPSRGLLTRHFAPDAIARNYQRGGAAAISVLTDALHFQGSLCDLQAARNAVRLPVLRKDFTIDETQILEAAAHGADAILLIAAILTESEMRRFRQGAEYFRMAALVEVHDLPELHSALASGARLIGVNNRDLRTFEVNLETSLCLAQDVPEHITLVAESGIQSAHDVQTLQAAGFKAFLVGEHLMRSDDPALAIQRLRSSEEGARP